MRRSGCGCLPWVVLLLVLGAVYWQLAAVAAVFGTIAACARSWGASNRGR
jgi:hypothetical protein